MQDSISENENTKVFRLKDVRAGSIVGGPWAATYFFYKNLKNIDQPDYARKALIIGILSPIPFLLFSIMFPGVSSFLGLAIYTVLIAFLTQRYQTAVMRAHEKMNGSFYSSNRATYTTLLFLAIYLMALFSFNYAVLKSKNSDYTAQDVLYAMFLPQRFDADKYNSLVSQINSKDSVSVTELQGLSDSASANTISKSQALEGLDKILKRYQENSKSISELNSIENVPLALSSQNAFIKEYTQLRIQQIELIRNSVDEETSSYNEDIEVLAQKIDTLLAKNKK